MSALSTWRASVLRVSSIRLRNFKRFTDLTVSRIPATAKLVVVVGPNGCGKSSLFDGFVQWYRRHAKFGNETDDGYFRKEAEEEFAWSRSVTVDLHDGEQPGRGSLYIRTAYRNDPDFNVSSFSKLRAPTESIRVARTIMDDKTVSQNYQRLLYETMAGVFDSGNDSKSVLELRKELTGKLQQSMVRVFGDLVLNSIHDPLGEGAFFFKKGNAQGYHYKNLSGGEKAAFDLLLDLHVSKQYFPNAIYCIDEVEAHLHTRVQGTILREIVEIVPDSSQLWLTTHSLGVIRAAQRMAEANPGSVSIIDFDGVDPDVPQELVPSNLGRVSWDKFLSLTLDDLSTHVAPRTVVLCEGSRAGSRRKDFDAEIYNQVLASEIPDVLFVSGGSAGEVRSSGVSVRETLEVILPGSTVTMLVDRDDRTDEEVATLESGGSIVLRRRNLESYLFADDVIEALVKSVGKEDLTFEALRLKQEALDASVARGNPADDLKSAAGEIYNGLRQLLDLRQAGNNSDAFMRYTLAPLIAPPMKTYADLMSDVMDRLPDEIASAETLAAR